MAEDSEDSSQPHRPRPAAPEEVCEQRALRRNTGGGRQDDGGVPRPPGHRAVHPGCHEYCKFHIIHHYYLQPKGKTLVIIDTTCVIWVTLQCASVVSSEWAFVTGWMQNSKIRPTIH